MRCIIITLLTAILCCGAGTLLSAPPEVSGGKQPVKKPVKKSRKSQPFRWVNPLPAAKAPEGVTHSVFLSPSMKVKVGYCIYLPPQYSQPQNTEKRFPVVYYLHGGRPGSELKSVSLAKDINAAIKADKVPPAIYVFVNGGEVSHYNYPARKSMGEDVFVQELIPHIDSTYRTIASRSGRGLEGFSQGGRGTARIMFKHPQLFCSCAPGGGGYATEKRISEEGGRENPQLIFAEGYNAYDLAEKYAANKKAPQLNILIFVGDKGFNYQNNLAYMQFLNTLKIPHQKIIVDGAKHSAREIYAKRGVEIMQFHAKNFALSGSTR